MQLTRTKDYVQEDKDGANGALISPNGTTLSNCKRVQRLDEINNYI